MDLQSPVGHAPKQPNAWRRLPLTAQLAAVGMLVALAWFLAARIAADQVEADARERNVAIANLHRVEVAASRLLGSLTAMSSAHGEFVLTGDTLAPTRYEQAKRAFSSDSALIHEFGTSDPRVLSALARIGEAVGHWERRIVERNFERRRRGGLAAFAPGTSGARALQESAELLDSLRIHHFSLARDVRDDVFQLAFETERRAAGDEWQSFVIRIAAVAVFILVITLLMRLVSRALNQVVTAAEALDAGRYDDARLPRALAAPNREMGRLATTFDRVALSIAARERQLQDDIEKLTELERLKADFVSTVSHELRTPLTSMRGALGLLLGGKAGELPAQGRELVRIALTNTDRLIRLINDILDIEKMDAGHVKIRRDRLRLRALLETTVSGLEGLARDADVRLVLNDPVDAEIIGDSDRLIQVFTNLGSNSIKFSPKGASVEITVENGPEGVRVSVRDHGPGIPDEFASRIFGRFQQAGGAASRQSGGTGLGLSIAKGITELHGGQVGFRSAEGGGTVFWVTLPIAPAVSGLRDARTVVLIIEDDESMRAVLSMHLDSFARPVGVGDAEGAFQALRDNNVKVVIVDHGLPGMDGLAFARRVRTDERHRTLPVILYSATEFSAEELKDSGIRASDVFVKTRDEESSLIDRVRREVLRTS